MARSKFAGTAKRREVRLIPVFLSQCSMLFCCLPSFATTSFLQPIPNQKIHWRSLDGLPNRYRILYDGLIMRNINSACLFSLNLQDLASVDMHDPYKFCFQS